MNYTQEVMDEISRQQAEVKQYSAPWCVGEQLKDIIAVTDGAAEIVLHDLKGEGMKLTDCEKKIAEFASAHRSGNTGCCPPKEADRIIREFYGLPSAGLAQTPVQAPAKRAGMAISLADFM